MLSQQLCKARSRSFLLTDLTIFLPIKSSFDYIEVQGLGWPLNGGYVLLLQPCDSSTCRVGRSIIMLKHEWMISVAKYVFHRIKKGFWQCSHIHVNVRIHVFIKNDQIANTVAVNDPPHHYRIIRFLLPMRRHSGIYFSPAILHTLTLPSQYARLNLDSSTKSKQDQLLIADQLRLLVHHRLHRGRFSRLMSSFCTATRL